MVRRRHSGNRGSLDANNDKRKLGNEIRGNWICVISELQHQSLRWQRETGKLYKKRKKLISQVISHPGACG